MRGPKMSKGCNIRNLAEAGLHSYMNGLQVEFQLQSLPLVRFRPSPGPRNLDPSEDQFCINKVVHSSGHPRSSTWGCLRRPCQVLQDRTHRLLDIIANNAKSKQVSGKPMSMSICERECSTIFNLSRLATHWSDQAQSQACTAARAETRCLPGNNFAVVGGYMSPVHDAYGKARGWVGEMPLHAQPKLAQIVADLHRSFQHSSST